MCVSFSRVSCVVAGRPSCGRGAPLGGRDAHGASRPRGCGRAGLHRLGMWRGWDEKRGGEMTEGGQLSHERGRESEKINVGIVPVFFHDFYRFYTFSCISRASLAILSPFFHSMPFFFNSHFFSFWNFCETIFPRGWMVCIHTISWKWHNFRFPRSIFEILSRHAFFSLLTLDRLEPLLYFFFFWQGVVLVFGRNFDKHEGLWPIFIFFVEVRFFYHWVVHAILGMLLLFFTYIVLSFLHLSSFSPLAAPVPGACQSCSYVCFFLVCVLCCKSKRLISM